MLEDAELVERESAHETPEIELVERQSFHESPGDEFMVESPNWKTFIVVISIEDKTIEIKNRVGKFWKRRTITTINRSFITKTYVIKTSNKETAQNLVLCQNDWNRIPIIINCYERTSGLMGMIENK